MSLTLNEICGPDMNLYLRDNFHRIASINDPDNDKKALHFLTDPHASR